MISTEEQRKLDKELFRECEGYDEDEDKPDGAYIEENWRFFNINKIKRLIKAGADVNAKDVVYGYSPLHRAVEMESYELAILLIEAGADVNAECKVGWSPLHWAKSVEVAELLISAGADVNAKDKFGRSPLHFRVVSKEMQDLLKKHGAEK